METNEILNTGIGGGKPYLGSPVVVQGIIRHYLFDLTSARTSQVQDGSDPVMETRKLATGVQDVFYGKDDRFLSFAWNKPGSLGKFLVERCGIGGEYDDAVFLLALRIAKEHFGNLVMYENDSISDEQMQSSIDDLIKKYTPLLCGMVGV